MSSSSSSSSTAAVLEKRVADLEALLEKKNTEINRLRHELLIKDAEILALTHIPRGKLKPETLKPETLTLTI